MRNTRAIIAGTLFAVSSLSIVSCEKSLQVDNVIYDAENQYHETKVFEYARNLYFQTDPNPARAYSTRVEEGREGINVTFYWDDTVTTVTNEEGETSKIQVNAGEWTLFISNAELARIVE